MSEKTAKDDVLFILGSENRKKILCYLRNKGEYASTSEISERTGINMGKVSFHCTKLAERNMIDKKIENGKANWLITEKGLRVLQEVEEREKGKNAQKQVVKSVK